MGSFDWTPDGKALVYAAHVGDKWTDGAVNLVRIERRAMTEPVGDPQPLATAAVAFQARVRALRDGRVLFASLALELPAPAHTEQSARFYLVEAAGNVAAVPSAPGVLPTELGSFAVSPDGRRVAVVESGSDVVAVLELANGTLEVVSWKRDGKCPTLPAWRNAHELYFAVFPREDARRPEWLCWSRQRGTQIVSGSWPDDLVMGHWWMEESNVCWRLRLLPRHP